MEEIDDNKDQQYHDDPLEQSSGELHKTMHLSGMYENWFLDYASYVILERAVPDTGDGLKPVQRRLLHSMKDLDDGRYNKVANIIGHTMKYHPHGDASIGDALVQMGQKDLLIDTQGNWGNVLTGDSAAAPRYIEARLSKFALEVVFNPKVTKWKTSYDGRNNEPVTLPVKFPLLLAQGVEGIAVGLASKILPHNFLELIDASIDILNGREYNILPDFNTGGLADFSKYNDGLRGGKVRIRAKINQVDKKTLRIYEIPYGTTTGNLIDSIIAANDKGKIKIRKIDDNTANEVEILIHLAPGISPDTTIDALYAFTQCEISISPNSCVIDNGKPNFMGISEILKKSTEQTLALLKRELEIQKAELEEQWHFSSLEKIFIEERIYRRIEKSETWESVISTIDEGLEPFKAKLKRDITRDDIIRLTEIKIKRISKYDSMRADDIIESIEDDIKEVSSYLDNLIKYAIDYFRKIRKKFGIGRERKTEIRGFDTIEAALVAAATSKLFIDRVEGFAGTALKKAEYVCECSDIDDIIVFREDGSFTVNKVDEKIFVGKDVIHIGIFTKNDDRTTYNLMYRDGLKGRILGKRFAVLGVTRDKDYILTKGAKGSKVLYFSANPNGEAEIVRILHKPRPKLKNLSIEFDFSTMAIKGRAANGNIITKYPVQKITKKEEGISTLGARNIWFDDTTLRLNTEDRGIYLGAFIGDDKILTITKSGYFRLHKYDLTSHFDEDILVIQKFNPENTISSIYLDGKINQYYLKRFKIDPLINGNKKIDFIGGHPESKLIIVTTEDKPQVEIQFDGKKKGPGKEIIDVNDFINLKSYKAKGKRLTPYLVINIQLLVKETEEQTVEEIGSESFIEDVENDTTEDTEVNSSTIDETEKKIKKEINVAKDEIDNKSLEKKETEIKPGKKTEKIKIEKDKDRLDEEDGKSQLEIEF